MDTDVPWILFYVGSTNGGKKRSDMSSEGNGKRRRTGVGQVLSEGNICWQRVVGRVQKYTSKYTSACQKICISCNQEVTEAKKCTGEVFLARCFYCEVRSYRMLRDTTYLLLSRRSGVRVPPGAPNKTKA